ncbi:MAG TPA: FAD-binding protein, partial [Propionibacterium sp.]|nr:FAD-binding protein [Propionibacterium sp.]
MTTQLPTPAPAWSRRTGVVVVGSGAAGLSTALHLADAAVPTVLLTRTGLADGATNLAQGGLAAVWGADDSVADHVADTLMAGAGLCDPDAVRELVEGAPAAIRRLIDLGARFDRDVSGDYDLHLEGGHHQRRILHAGGDASGAEVVATLSRALGRAASGSVQVAECLRAIDVLLDHTGSACGVTVRQDDGTIGEFVADAVVLAAGGVGQLWGFTTNPGVATGDGLAMAYRAGAALRDVEFVQFHPTLLAVPRGAGDQRDVLISEAVRGEGAFLVDGNGTRVMEGVHPLADLAPRDVVSAAMAAHLARTGEPHLFLDARHFGAEAWAEKFPTILSLCRARGVDPVTDLIPVHPGAHYLCGGVLADLDGHTTVHGLFAVGEVAGTGVQGANRLASNSVTEALVAGDRVGALLAASLGGDHPRTVRTPVRPTRRPAAPLVDP